MGRKTHILKALTRDNAQARESLLAKASELKKINLIVDYLHENGLKVADKVVRIDKISVPTLTSILKDIGHTISKGRPKSDGSKLPIWASMPQAISAIKEAVESKGLDGAVEYLNREGISFGSTKITFKEDNSLSVAMLSKVLGKKTKIENEDEIEEKQTKPIENLKDQYDLDDEDEDEEDEDEEDEDEEDEDEEDDDEDEEDEDNFLDDEDEEDEEEDEDEEHDDDDDDDYDDEISDF